MSEQTKDQILFDLEGLVSYVEMIDYLEDNGYIKEKMWVHNFIYGRTNTKDAIEKLKSIRKFIEAK